MRRFSLWVALACLTAGCNDVSLVDDVDVDLDFTSLNGPSDGLHLPYVQGAQVRIYVETSRSTDMHSWTLESSNPSVLEVVSLMHDADANGRLSAACAALADGTATLIVRDGSRDVQSRHDAQVRLPDRIDLLAHGLLLIGRPESQAQLDTLRVLEGGTATFLASYHAGAQPLYGNGALTVDAPAAIDALPRRTFLSENRDWLEVTPLSASDGTLGLRAGGTHVADVPVHVVSAAEVSALRIIGQDESRAKEGQWLVALGVASDAAGNTVYGVQFDWEVDGQAQLGGLGDLYRYQFDPTKPKNLAASFGSLSQVARIHWGGGYVDSSNHLGCQASGGGSPTAFLLIFALLILNQCFRRSRYMRQLLLSGSSSNTDSHSRRASSLRPSE
jgi:hypothetical protein